MSAVLAEPLPLLERRVTYDEVAERVLNVTCRHCHGKPSPDVRGMSDHEGWLDM